MKRLLDTSAYVALRKGHLPVSQAVRESEEFYFSTVVLGEILFGFRNGSRFEENMKKLEEFLDDHFDVVPGLPFRRFAP